MKTYIALIHKDAESDYGVSFPDLPGCVTAGSDLDEARVFAAEALALHLAGLAEDGDDVPEPSSLEAVMSDPLHRDGVAVFVEAPSTTQAEVRVDFLLPEADLDAIDRRARSLGQSRQDFLLSAARASIAR